MTKLIIGWLLLHIVAFAVGIGFMIVIERMVTE